MKSLTCYRCYTEYNSETGKRYLVPGLKNYQFKCPNCGCKIGIHIPAIHGDMK